WQVTPDLALAASRSRARLMAVAPVAIAALALIVVYVPVTVETRYIGAAVCVLVVALAGGLGRPRQAAHGRDRPDRGCAARARRPTLDVARPRCLPPSPRSPQPARYRKRRPNRGGRRLAV